MRNNLKSVTLILIGLVFGFFLQKLLPKKVSSPAVTSQVKCTKETCCDEIKFCGISEDELKHYVSNYQNFNWSKTSKYYEEVDYTINTKGDAFIQDLPIPSRLSHLDTTDLFDAGFMDVPIADMENYICAIKNNALSASRDRDDEQCCGNPDILRFYYIRYDGPQSQEDNDFQDYDENYDYKHSLAIVPICISEDGAEEECLSEDDDFNSTFIWAPRYDCQKSSIANHNIICPPFLGCDKNTVLRDVYGSRRYFSDNDNGSVSVSQNSTP